MQALLLVVLLCGSVISASASIDSCLQTLRPHLTIGEKDLLDVEERWSEMTKLKDDDREEFLQFAGFEDSTGAIPSAVKAYDIVSCTTSEATGSIVIKLMYVKGVEGTKDENVYLVTMKNGMYSSKFQIASLQASCEGTFLRASSTNDDGTISVGQLFHVFDCETDKFLNTETQPTLTVRIRPNGSITQGAGAPAPTPTKRSDDE
jgi:hypothetical protein